MKISDFTDERMADIATGAAPMTHAERAFLLADVPRFEECTYSADDLAALDGPALMRAAYGVWADYASGQV